VHIQSKRFFGPVCQLEEEIAKTNGDWSPSFFFENSWHLNDTSKGDGDL